MKQGIDLSHLPSGWNVVELGDHLERIANGLTATQEQEQPGIPVSRIETISTGTINFDRVRYVRDIDEKTKSNFLLQYGDILFSHINSDLHLGKTAVYCSNKPLLHGMNLLVLRTRKETLNSYYLHYLLNYYRREGRFIKIAQHAVNQSSLNQQKIKTILVPLAPIEEQKWIVAEIEKQFSLLDEAVANLKRVKANLKRYKATVLKAAVEGPLSKPLNKSNFTAWKRLTLPQLCNNMPNSIRRGPFGSAIKKKIFVPDGYKVYEQQNAIYDDCSLGHYYINEAKFRELAPFAVKAGDIIISCSGTVGRISVLPSWAKPGVINQALLKLTLNQDVVLNAYFVMMFQYKVREILLQSTRGSAMQNITGVADLKKIEWPVPPLGAQHRIIADFERYQSVIEELEVTIQTSLTRADRLRQSVLAQVFSGGLKRFQ